MYFQLKENSNLDKNLLLIQQLDKDVYISNQSFIHASDAITGFVSMAFDKESYLTKWALYIYRKDDSNNKKVIYLDDLETIFSL